MRRATQHTPSFLWCPRVRAGSRISSWRAVTCSGRAARRAQAVKDADLIELAERCHPDTLRQLKWADAMLKTLSPQVLAS
jgi:hypothetical protein